MPPNNVLQGLVFAGAAFLLSQQAVSTSATQNTGSVDTLGKGDTIFLFHPSATTGAAAAVKIQDSPDDSVWADLTGAALSTMPSATDDGKLFAIIVTKRGTAHDRYLRGVWVQGGSGSSTIDVVAIHSNASEAPSTAAEAGLEGLVVA